MVDKKVKKVEKSDKVENTAPVHQTHKSTTNKNYLTYAIIAVILILVIVFVYNKYSPQTTTEENTIAASVNGEEIRLSELDKTYSSLPPQYKATTSKKELLSQMIEARLIYQEAKKEGTVVDNAQAEQYIQTLKFANQLTEEQFQQALAQQNITEEELKTQFIKQSTSQMFLNQTITSKVNVTDKEVKEYYDENKDKFKVEESVSVRHILIGDPELSAEERNTTAQELLKNITKNSFCEYVTEHSTDTASVSACGEYNFTKADSFVPEFKEFSFSQPAGKIGIVQTQFGSHIIYIVKKTPAKTSSYNEVKDQIKGALIAQKAQEDYKVYYEELLSRSLVNIYYDESSEE